MSAKTPSPLMSVTEALLRILATAPEPLGSETVAIADGFGRTIAADIRALRTQPPFAVSAMDGYAVQAAYTAASRALRLIGESAAGSRFAGRIGPGETVRIFTGAPMPDGADSVLIQENADRTEGMVTPREPTTVGRHVRAAGLDFREGEVGLAAGTRLNPAELALCAAMNHATLPVVRKPRVAILATGDELVSPGQTPGPDQIVASNSFAIAAIVRAAGGLPIDLGIVGDDLDLMVAAIGRAQAAEADVLVTLGGASVGDHDLVQDALTRAGMDLSFWKIAMRPGKPLMHGRIGEMRVLGLPGNPVSSIVCGTLFVRPLVRALCGDTDAGADPTEPAILAGDLAANDSRQDYMRGVLAFLGDGGLPRATANRAQDSSMLRILAKAGCLIVRPPHAPAATAGDPCRIIRLDRYPA